MGNSLFGEVTVYFEVSAKRMRLLKILSTIEDCSFDGISDHGRFVNFDGYMTRKLIILIVGILWPITKNKILAKKG
jgi:hypothetical protein